MENLKTDIIILNTRDIQALYGLTRDETYAILNYVFYCYDVLVFLTRDETYAILNSKGCPRIKGGHNKHYKVIKDEFEKFLRNRKA